jgi:hypothetical protein
MATDTPTDLRWLALINDFQRSGLTHAEFCRKREISLHTFRKRLYGQKALARAVDGNRDPVALAPTRFLPVTLEPDGELPLVPPADPLVIILPGGRRVVVGKGFDPETLRRLIDAIEPSR